MTLQFEAFEDMQTAMKTLPAFFGSKLNLNVKFDLLTQKFVKISR